MEATADMGIPGGGILFFFLFFFLNWSTLKNREKIVHSYGCAELNVYQSDIQIFICAQNPHKSCTNSAQIVLFFKKWQKVRKHKN